MTFDDIRPVDFNAPQKSRAVQRDRYLLQNKLEKHLAIGKAARPFWTAAAGLIPFGLGSLVTAGSDALTDANIDKQNDKLNSYSAALGEDQTYNYSRLPSLDLSGLGQGIGSAAGIPQSFGDLKGNGKQDATGMNMSDSFGGGTAGLFAGDTNVTAPDTMQGAQTIDVSQEDSNYWSGLWGGKTGGGVTGLRSYETMEKGGKIKGASHEEGGIALIDTKTGEDTGIRVEGEERVVNDKDWTQLLSLLASGKTKQAKNLLQDIDKRVPQKEGASELDPDDEDDIMEMANGGEIKLGGDTSRWNWDGLGSNGYRTVPSDNIPYTVNNDIVAAQLSTQDNMPAPVEDVVMSKSITTPNINLEDTLGNVYDFARFGLGTAGAATKLPKWRVSGEWNDYVDRQKYLSEQGILPEERAIMNNRNDAQYAAQVRDLANYSGGDAGALLGNLAVANRDRYAANADIALKDRLLKNQSLDKYGNVLLQDIGLQKDAFDIGYNEALATARSGASLAANAMDRIVNRRNDSFDKQNYEQFAAVLKARGLSDGQILTALSNAYNPADIFASQYFNVKETPNTVAPNYQYQIPSYLQK